MLEKIFPKIHTEGYKFLAIAIFVTHTYDDEKNTMLIYTLLCASA